ncbi:hypothetical protein PILCRDRAFT_821162 [Piloderma croceum F 1598]|uniref:Uncharacterized protein n=1 Tax=Piloderma croceum (strain F 1598) TaxID=765440 RepID=A0A0C3FAX3_PILCF|nr:hypothetical protein PILCRDRAFT_821162 [Piloderma croceum F 1598]
MSSNFSSTPTLPCISTSTPTPYSPTPTPSSPTPLCTSPPVKSQVDSDPSKVSSQLPDYSPERLGEKYFLKDLPMPDSLESGESAQIFAAYAIEACNVLHAEAFIAERRYRQMTMAAQPFKLHMMRTRFKYLKASQDVARYRSTLGASEMVL